MISEVQHRVEGAVFPGAPYAHGFVHLPRHKPGAAARAIGGRRQWWRPLRALRARLTGPRHGTGLPARGRAPAAARARRARHGAREAEGILGAHTLRRVHKEVIDYHFTSCTYSSKLPLFKLLLDLFNTNRTRLIAIINSPLVRAPTDPSLFHISQ